MFKRAGIFKLFFKICLEFFQIYIFQNIINSFGTYACFKNAAIFHRIFVIDGFIHDKAFGDAILFRVGR